MVRMPLYSAPFVSVRRPNPPRCYRCSVVFRAVFEQKHSPREKRKNKHTKLHSNSARWQMEIGRGQRRREVDKGESQ
jgi:hypothetical protein